MSKVQASAEFPARRRLLGNKVWLTHADCGDTGCVFAALAVRVVCPELPGVRPASPAWEVSAASLQSLLHNPCVGLLVVDMLTLARRHELPACTAEALRTS